MRKKLQNTTAKIAPFLFIILLLFLWQIISFTGIVAEYLLPSPISVIKAGISDFPLLISHLGITLLEAFLGLGIGILFGFFMAVVMDRYSFIYRACYPLLVITQTIPTIAIAPLLVLWMGYGIAPKVTLIVIVTFFPIAVGLLEGFRSSDQDTIQLLRTMGANRNQIFRYVKLPGAMNPFFSSLRISTSYAVVGAVISEWLGGYQGLGVYMTRVRKSYAFDKMFAVIFLISAISLLLMWAVKQLQRKLMPWEVNFKKTEKNKESTKE